MYQTILSSLPQCGAFIVDNSGDLLTGGIMLVVLICTLYFQGRWNRLSSEGQTAQFNEQLEVQRKQFELQQAADREKTRLLIASEQRASESRFVQHTLLSVYAAIFKLEQGARKRVQSAEAVETYYSGLTSLQILKYALGSGSREEVARINDLYDATANFLSAAATANKNRISDPMIEKVAGTFLGNLSEWVAAHADSNISKREEVMRNVESSLKVLHSEGYGSFTYLPPEKNE